MKFKNTIILALTLSPLQSCIGMDNSIVSTTTNLCSLRPAYKIYKRRLPQKENTTDEPIFTEKEIAAFTITANTKTPILSFSEKMELILQAAKNFVNSSPQERYTTWAEVIINTCTNQNIVTKYKKELLLLEQITATKKLANEIEIKKEKIKQAKKELDNITKENDKLKKTIQRQEKKQQQIADQKRETDIQKIREQLEIAAKQKEKLEYILEREEKKERIIEALKKEEKIKEEKRKTKIKQPIQHIEKDPITQKLNIKRKLIKINGCHTEIKLKTILSNFCVNRKKPILCFFEKLNLYEAFHYSHKMNNKVVNELTILIGDEIDSYKCHQCDFSSDDESF